MLALLPLQATPWLPVWITPLWILAAGIAVGMIVCIVIFAILAVLSRIPGLGTLGDRPAVANIASLVVAVVVGAGTMALYLPLVESEYRALMIVPIALMSVVVGFGLIFGMWRRSITELWSILTEGVMAYVMGTAALVMVVGLATTPLVNDHREILASLSQVNWASDGQIERTAVVDAISPDVDPDDAPFKNFIIPFNERGVDRIEIETNRTVILADAELPKDFGIAPTRLDPDTPYEWSRGDLKIPPLPPASAGGVWIQNREIDPATVTFRIISRPAVRQVSTIVVTAFSFVLMVFTFLAFRQAAPRMAAIALATAKSEMAQPLYIVLLAIGTVALLIFMILPFNTLGEDIKLLKDSGMTLIMVLGMIQAVWSAGTSVSEEIEGRTALTVLSKPVSRRSFLLGKYVGIMMSVFVLFIILGVILMVITAYKPIFEARETSQGQPIWQETHMEMVSLVPGLVLYFMETMAIGAIGVALATRLAMLANFVICLSVYVVGNLTSPLVQSSAGDNELVGFVGKLIAVVVPNLNTFNIQSAVDAGNAIPAIYLAGALNYLVCFSILALMVALLLFEDRDLA
jgi:ABC-type transport system involved in multi-copper enzyme maturation permease subunit